MSGVKIAMRRGAENGNWRTITVPLQVSENWKDTMRDMAEALGFDRESPFSEDTTLKSFVRGQIFEAFGKFVREHREQLKNIFS